MKPFPKSVLALLFIIILLSCNQKKELKKIEEEEKRKTVEMVTDYGTITIQLYNETPLHRDNFIKLAKSASTRYTWRGRCFIYNKGRI